MNATIELRGLPLLDHLMLNKANHIFYIYIYIYGQHDAYRLSMEVVSTRLVCEVQLGGKRQAHAVLCRISREIFTWRSRRARRERERETEREREERGKRGRREVRGDSKEV